MPPIIRPRALAPGDTIAIAALSSGLETGEGPNLPLSLGVRAAIDADALTIELLEAAMTSRSGAGA